MDSNIGQSYQDAICGALVAGMCYLRVRGETTPSPSSDNVSLSVQGQATSSASNVSVSAPITKAEPVNKIHVPKCS